MELEPIVAAAVEHNVILELNNHSFSPMSARATSAHREREFAEAAFAAEVERMFEEDLARSRVWPLASSTGSRGGSDSARASPD